MLNLIMNILLNHFHLYNITQTKVTTFILKTVVAWEMTGRCSIVC